ncbi:MAG: bacterioferritin-associated ferredoxin [Methylophilaceae bacterium]|jgi:bacterioferritin-associated ferredoxin
MYVCVCNGVTERQVYKAIDAGATTVKALSRQLGVGTQCGTCVGCAKACLSKAHLLETQSSKTELTSNVFPIAKSEAA